MYWSRFKIILNIFLFSTCGNTTKYKWRSILLISRLQQIYWIHLNKLFNFFIIHDRLFINWTLPLRNCSDSIRYNDQAIFSSALCVSGNTDKTKTNALNYHQTCLTNTKCYLRSIKHLIDKVVIEQRFSKRHTQLHRGKNQQEDNRYWGKITLSMKKNYLLLFYLLLKLLRFTYPIFELLFLYYCARQSQMKPLWNCSN